MSDDDSNGQAGFPTLNMNADSLTGSTDTELDRIRTPLPSIPPKSRFSCLPDLCPSRRSIP